jgi:hypothetical protein
MRHCSVTTVGTNCAQSMQSPQIAAPQPAPMRRMFCSHTTRHIEHSIGYAWARFAGAGMVAPRATADSSTVPRSGYVLRPCQRFKGAMTRRTLFPLCTRSAELQAPAPQSCTHCVPSHRAPFTCCREPQSGDDTIGNAGAGVLLQPRRLVRSLNTSSIATRRDWHPHRRMVVDRHRAKSVSRM